MTDTALRRSFTEHEQAIMWELWSQGKSLSEIGRYINKHAASVFCFLGKYGGIKPANPKPSKRALTLSEREEISRGLSAQLWAFLHSRRNLSLINSPLTIGSYPY